jgi:hypothetical protein
MTMEDTTRQQDRLGWARETAAGVADKVREGAQEAMQRTADEARQGPTPTGLQAMLENLPTPVYLYATLGSIGLSLLLRLVGRKEFANFVGLWPPTILALAMINKQLRPSREMERP